MTPSILLATLLPVIPQPSEFKPSEGVCDVKNAAVRVVKSSDASLGEEGYTLKLNPGTVEIAASAPAGVLWARQTLAQLAASGEKTPCGVVRDVPKYRVRGFMMDVGRMYHSMEFLYDLADKMAYYKMNVLQIHLNDNEIEKNPKADWSTKQAAFRMECETCPALTAKDGHYTKKEFREFMLHCKSIGITVIPEFDVPAHALAFTRARPDFASKKYGADHFDLDKTDEILAWLKPIFAEYLTGDEPVFIGPYMHVGTDEYNKAEAEKFRAFTDKMFRMVQGFGYKVCAWGALTHAKGETPVLAGRDITIDIWHNPYYQPAEAIAAGYTIVAIPDGLVYLVPFAGYYYDYLNCQHLFNNWEPNKIGDYIVPEDKMDQLAGGKFALWNDMLGKKKDGSAYTEKDNMDRIYPALQTLGQKFWSGKRADQTWEEFSKLAETLKK
ncbi:MAG: family 20 glycosylhydrolase [Kiritimatiellae bacterium]|nr:family 20 glycosylhydrolase [Kiritimatiellia bacterium]